jgi:hypothetical protein
MDVEAMECQLPFVMTCLNGAAADLRADRTDDALKKLNAIGEKNSKIFFSLASAHLKQGAFHQAQVVGFLSAQSSHATVSFACN